MTETFRAGRSHNPKTILGFLATVVGIVTAGCASAGSAMLFAHIDVGYVMCVFGFAALLVVAVLIMVFIVLLQDPSKLLLTHVTGGEYIEIQRGIVLGDSLMGEMVVPEMPTGPENLLVEPTTVVPVGNTEEESHDE